jgi:hypothetical protein
MTHLSPYSKYCRQCLTSFLTQIVRSQEVPWHAKTGAGPEYSNFHHFEPAGGFRHSRLNISWSETYFTSRIWGYGAHNTTSTPAWLLKVQYTCVCGSIFLKSHFCQTRLLLWTNVVISKYNMWCDWPVGSASHSGLGFAKVNGKSPVEGWGSAHRTIDTLADRLSHSNTYTPMSGDSFAAKKIHQATTGVEPMVKYELSSWHLILSSCSTTWAWPDIDDHQSDM